MKEVKYNYKYNSIPSINYNIIKKNNKPKFSAQWSNRSATICYSGIYSF